MLTEPCDHGTSLFLFAHPDDEFGCFEAIRSTAARGDRAICVYLTDGAYGGQPVAPRMRESISVLGRLGVDAADVHFLGVEHGIGDGSLPQHIDAAYLQLMVIMAAHAIPDHVYSTAWEGGHQDHDATFLVARTFTREKAPGARFLQFSLYNGRGLAGPLFRVMSALPGQGPITELPITWRQRLTYLRLCMAYPSQWKTWLGLLPFVALTLFFRGTYLVQEAAQGLLRRPHEGALLYERRGSMTWETFSRDCSAFMAA